MNGLRMIGTWAMSPFRRLEKSHFRILGAAQLPLTKPLLYSEIDADRGRNLSMVSGSPKFRFNSQKNGAESGGKGRKFWSSLAAGLLGLGGTMATFSSVDEFKKSFFLTAHCAADCNNECVDKKCDQSDCLRKTDREEELIAKANSELEKALKDTKPKAVEYTEAALKAYCEAIEAIKAFMNKTYCAVEEENLESPRFEEVWCDVYEALKKRCELAKLAMEKGQCAWELLRRLREIIENGKACKYTACNPLLVTAEETLMCAEKELCNKKAAMDALLKESRVVEQYRNIVEEFRRDLKAEADSLVPSDDCKVTLSDNEANMVFAHAYKKILRVQKEMNKDSGKC